VADEFLKPVLNFPAQMRSEGFRRLTSFFVKGHAGSLWFAGSACWGNNNYQRQSSLPSR
jgi:hypothetical protein